MKGRCWKYGADINTDLIIAGRYLNTTDPKLLAGHCMEDLDPAFAARVKNSDAGAAVLAFDQCCHAYFNTGHIGDGIELAGCAFKRDAQVTRAGFIHGRPFLGYDVAWSAGKISPGTRTRRSE